MGGSHPLHQYILEYRQAASYQQHRHRKFSATEGANFIRRRQGLPSLTLDFECNPLRCIQGATKALFEQAEIAIYERSQPGFVAPAVVGGEKGIQTAWVVANDADGSLSMSAEGQPGAKLLTDDRIPALKREKASALGVAAKKRSRTQHGMCPSCMSI